jgi:transposase-like protein
VTTHQKWSPTEKFQVVIETFSPIVNMSTICRIHGIHDSGSTIGYRLRSGGMRGRLTDSVPPGYLTLRGNARLKGLIEEEARISVRLKETVRGTPEENENGGLS